LAGLRSACGDRIALSQSFHPLIPCSPAHRSSSLVAGPHPSRICLRRRRAWFLVAFHAALQIEKKVYPRSPIQLLLALLCFVARGCAPRVLFISTRALLHLSSFVGWTPCMSCFEASADVGFRVPHQRFCLACVCFCSMPSTCWACSTAEHTCIQGEVRVCASSRVHFCSMSVTA
jgi:hypothetical protein